MTIRNELDEFDTILARVRHDLGMLARDERLYMPRWKFVRAAIRHTVRHLENSQAYLREAHSFVPEDLDNDA